VRADETHAHLNNPPEQRRRVWKSAKPREGG
jgi:hypothetical protein